CFHVVDGEGPERNRRIAGREREASELGIDAKFARMQTRRVFAAAEVDCNGSPLLQRPSAGNGQNLARSSTRQFQTAERAEDLLQIRRCEPRASVGRNKYVSSSIWYVAQLRQINE